MHGLVSLLPQPYYRQVEELWDDLEDDFHLRGIRVTPYPHFSWQIAQDYEFEHLEAVVRDLATAIAPFTVRTTGLGLFSGPQPGIYLPVVKDASLLSTHDLIWEQTARLSQGISPYYNPQNWIPHISLAYTDVDTANIGGVMSRLAFCNFTWEMTIDNISLIYEPEGAIGELRFKIPLIGSARKE